MKDVDLATIDTSSTANLGEGFNFSFNAPEALVKLVAAIKSFSSDPDEIYDEVLGLYARGFDARYPSTPIEFFPIGTTGMDGEHMGFVNRTPELEPDDLPFAFITPSAQEGAFCIGRDAQSGLERLMSGLLKKAEEDNETKTAGIIRDVAKTAGFNLDPAGFGNPGPFYGGPALIENGEPMRIPVEIPEGYHFEAAADGIGVLAPKTTFKPGFTTSIIEAMDFEATDKMYEEGFQELIDAGHAGSALLFAKHSLYSEGMDDEETWKMFSDCYRALGRDGLAKIAGLYEEI